MKQNFCTYFDRNYLSRGLALIESLTKQCEDFSLYIVCMDEYTRLVLEELMIPQLVLIPFHEIESKDKDLTACKSNRKVVEYIWTCTPTIINYILNKYPELEYLVYVDADLYFFSDPKIIYDEMPKHSVLIHEHRFPERCKHLDVHGIYNVGLLVFKNNIEAKQVLLHWRNQCFEWCHDYVDGERFGDQKYLNNWTKQFPQVKVTENIGVGVAPWNHEQYQYTYNDKNQPCVNGVPIVFYHYHSFKIVHPEIYVPAPAEIWRFSKECIIHCIIPYVQAIIRAQKLLQSNFGDFQYGFVGNDFKFDLQQVILASQNISSELIRAGFTHYTENIENNWTIFKGQQYFESLA